MSRRRTILVALVAALFAAGCSSGSDTATPTPELAATPFTFAVTATSTPSGVDVTGTTSLPDNALVTISLAQPIRLDGENDSRSVDVDGDGVRVVGGAFHAALASDIAKVAALSDPTAIAAVGPTMTVCAKFETGAEDGASIQEPEVVKVVGPKGERLAASPGRKVFGAATDNPVTWLAAKADVDVSPNALIEGIAAAQGRRPVAERLDTFC